MSRRDGGSDQKFDYVFKVVMIGDSAVGKSQLLARFAKNEFSLDAKATLGVEFHSKTLKLDGKTVKAQIWDTAGQERYRAVTTAYYRGVNGAMLVYDISNRSSFDHAGRWLEELRGHAGNNTIMILIGNKCDLDSHRAVPTEDGRDFAETENLYFIETSALETTNVENAFSRIFTAIYETMSKKSLAAGESIEYPESSSLAGKKITFPREEGGGGRSGCCT